MSRVDIIDDLTFIKDSPGPGGALDTEKSKTKIKIEDISAISTPPGCPWGSTERGDPIEFDFLGLECNHQVLEQLEPKNLPKTDNFNEFLLF